MSGAWRRWAWGARRRAGALRRGVPGVIVPRVIVPRVIVPGVIGAAVLFGGGQARAADPVAPPPGARYFAWSPMAADADGVVAHGLPRSAFWQRARVPGYGAAERVWRVAQRAHLPRFLLGDEREPVLLQQAALLIELAGGAALPHPELVGYLGYLLVHSELGREAEGRQLAQRALTHELPAPVRGELLFAVAIASHRLGDSATEVEAYGQALELEWEPEHRATLFMNRAEALMAQGELRRAIEGYQQALAVSSAGELYALASFGLALALARAGELPRALVHVARAARARVALDGGITVLAIELPSVFFSPAHEIEAYRALAAMGLAEGAPPEQTRALLGEAVARWSLFLRGAAHDGGRWAENAEQLRAWCVERLKRLGNPSAHSARSRPPRR